MSDETRLKVFLDSLNPGNTPYLEQLEREAHLGRVPIIRRQTQSAIKVILKMKQPVAILEIGTAIGFSSIFMCTYSYAHVTTIENYRKRIPIAEEHFKESGYADRITFLKGDAGEILPTLDGTYDLIFMDAAKGQYIEWLPLVLRLLKTGGVLLSDNVLQDGDLLKSRYAVERRNRTIHKRMRDYLHAVTKNEQLTTTVLPVGDGLAVSVKQSLERK